MLRIIVYKNLSQYPTLFILLSINVILKDLNEVRITNSSSKSQIYCPDYCVLFFVHLDFYFGSISCKLYLGFVYNINRFFSRLIILQTNSH